MRIKAKRAKFFLLLAFLGTTSVFLLAQDEIRDLNGTYWVFEPESKYASFTYYEEEYYYESNGAVARKTPYLIKDDTICFDYNPRYREHRFLEIVRLTKDTMEIRGLDPELTSITLRSSEEAFLASLKGFSRESLERVLKGSKYYDRIEEIIGEE